MKIGILVLISTIILSSCAFTEFKNYDTATVDARQAELERIILYCEHMADSVDKTKDDREIIFQKCFINNNHIN